jgi:hypothetical protein
VGNREHKPYPKQKRVRPTRHGVAGRAAFEINVVRRGPVTSNVRWMKIVSLSS